MNCIELAYRHAKTHPERTAIWMPGRGGGSSVTFAELFAWAGSVRRNAYREGLRPGDTVLLVEGLSPRLYAAVLGLLGFGCTVMLVEPWMPISKIDEVVKASKPDAFLAGATGKAWGLRVASIRRIPKWLSIRHTARFSTSKSLEVELVDGERPGILTFTSGTTGRPKGVVRTHRFLIDQHRVLENALDYGHYPGPDLCIFANFTLANLASGRTTLLVPPAWKRTSLKQFDQLPPGLQPDTMTCGPAFLLSLMRYAEASSLKSIHIGGALTDCWIFEEGFSQWPDAHWTHVYGSTEAEPVALADARLAVSKSRERGLFQTLYVGRPIEDIQIKQEKDNTWVAGPHVCPAYIGNEAANRANKRKDGAGTIWHSMGDRLEQEEDGLWYRGRSFQDPDDFDLEQSIYTDLQSSKSFVHRTERGSRLLIGEVDSRFNSPEIDSVRPARIYRDRRHRARIDRQKSYTRRSKWLRG